MKFIAHIFVLFCFFPFIDILKIGTDTQPNALLLAPLIILGVKDKKINAPIILLWITFFLSLFLVFYNNLSFFIYSKNVLNYLSIPLVCTAMYVLLNKVGYKIEYKFFTAIIITYALVGLIQMYVNPNLFDFLLNMQRGALLGGRGVSSLSTEPAYYGTTCLFFMIFSLIMFNRKQNVFLQAFLAFQLFFISRSATAIALFMVALVLFTLFQVLRLKWKYFVVTVITLLIAIPVLLHEWSKVEDTRVGHLAEEFIKNPLMLAQFDGSVSTRITSALTPFMALSHDYALPRGLGYYQDFLSDFYTRGQYRSFLSLHAIRDKPRLGGSMNLVLFQLGFLGLFFPLAVYMAFRKSLSNDAVKFSFILLVLIMFTQIQMMHGMFGVLLASALHNGNLSKQQLQKDF